MGNGIPIDKYELVLKRFIEGDNNILSVIYFDFIDVLLNFGLKYTADQGLVEDCIHNLFIDLLKNRKKLGAVANIKFYLFKSLFYQIQKERLKTKDLPTDRMPSDSPFLISYSVEKSIISDEINQSREKMLALLLTKLTPKQRELLYLKYNCGFSYIQISEILQIDVSSARKMVYRTLKSLRENFAGVVNLDLLFLIFKQPH
ncbi:MAG: sigma-70 family RNA polymerase sigma factor [Prolixibacteraceae bacterium]